MLARTAVGVVGLGLLCCSCSAQVPLDSELIGRFRAQQGIFERLASLARSDTSFSGVRLTSFGLIAFEHDGPGYERRLAPEDVRQARWREYRELLSLGKILGMRRERNGNVEFILWRGEDSHRGLLYSAEPPTPLRSSLDDWGKAGRDLYSQYRSIQPNWYLFVWPRFD